MLDDWQIKLTLQAEKDLKILDEPVRQRVVEKLHWLVINFSSIVPIPLNNIWRDYCKLRVGDWRVVYRPDYQSKTIIVYNIGRRDEVYKP